MMNRKNVVALGLAGALALAATTPSFAASVPTNSAAVKAAAPAATTDVRWRGGWGGGWRGGGWGGPGIGLGIGLGLAGAAFAAPYYYGGLGWPVLLRGPWGGGAGAGRERPSPLRAAPPRPPPCAAW